MLQVFRWNVCLGEWRRQFVKEVWMLWLPERNEIAYFSFDCFRFNRLITIFALDYELKKKERTTQWQMR